MWNTPTGNSISVIISWAERLGLSGNPKIPVTGNVKVFSNFCQSALCFAYPFPKVVVPGILNTYLQDKNYCPSQQKWKRQSELAGKEKEDFDKKVKVPMKWNLFLFSFKIHLVKYAIPKFETPGVKSNDFTSLQSWAILPSKIVFETRGQNATWHQPLTSLWCQNRSHNGG